MSAPTASTDAALSLQVEGITAGYGRTTVLRDVSLTVAPGEVTGIVGPNGGGKTTLLRVMAGLIKPTSGRVLVGGEDVTAAPAHVRTRNGLCLIPEGRGIYRSMTVRDNLAVQANSSDLGAAIDRAAEAFPILRDRLGQVAGTLSGGQQQMLSMAAAYVRGAKVILVNEPSLGLAPVVVDSVFEFLETVAGEGEGVSLLIVDQFISRVLAISSHVYLMRRGQLTDLGRPEDVGDDIFEKYVG